MARVRKSKGKGKGKGQGQGQGQGKASRGGGGGWVWGAAALAVCLALTLAALPRTRTHSSNSSSGSHGSRGVPREHMHDSIMGLEPPRAGQGHAPRVISDAQADALLARFRAALAANQFVSDSDSDSDSSTASCVTDTRLLVTNFDSANNFEGLASVLSALAEALAEAMHDRRTLVLGPYASLPALFVREIQGCDDADNPMSCFFAPLSSCSWWDVTKAEVLAFKSRMQDDAARVKVYEARRGALARYVPPLWLVDAPEDRAHPTVKALWNAALLEFVSRPSDSSSKALAAHVDGLATLARPILGVHIRHGDLALRHGDGQLAYTNRPQLALEDYIDAVAASHGDGSVACAAGSVAGCRLDVASIYLSTDNPKAAEFAGEFERAFPGLEVRVLDAFRTSKGSHTIVSLRALPPQDIAHIKARQPELASAASVRRVIEEAQRDITLLSHCDAFVGTATSFFSTFPAGLRVAHGHTSLPHYMDRAKCETGEFHPAVYHGSLKRTNYLAEGWKRWHVLLARFMDVVWTEEHQQAPGAPWVQFDGSTGHLVVPLPVFDNEAVYWDGTLPDLRLLGCTDDTVRPEFVSTAEQATEPSDPDYVSPCVLQLIDDGADLVGSWSYDKALMAFRRALSLPSKPHIAEVAEGNEKAALKEVSGTMAAIVGDDVARHKDMPWRLIGGPTAQDAAQDVPTLVHFESDAFAASVVHYFPQASK